MNNNLRLLRYNTGTDKQVFVKFKDQVSAVIFNATIVAYSSSAVADLVSVHKNQYIIDPQTHIYQHDISAIQTVDKSGTFVIKKSVDKYLDLLPLSLKELYLSHNGRLSPDDIKGEADALVGAVFEFETKYVNKYIEGKEYDKYLSYVNIGPQPQVVIAPYFTIKSSYSAPLVQEWMKLNRIVAEKFESINNSAYSMGVQIVLEKEMLENDGFIDSIKPTYAGINAEYAFIWVDEFNLFEATQPQQIGFKKMLIALTELGIKPVMAYGGYDCVMLCNNDVPFRMYGVAHSVGYGETRAITPVGGGLPVNKYYFPPLHSRMSMSKVIEILRQNGYFAMDKLSASEKFYSSICACRQCTNVIKNDFDNFNYYNESIPFTIRGKITRNRPTADASLIAAMHFMNAKMKEWEMVENKTFKQLSDELIKAYALYEPTCKAKIEKWCEIYGQ